MACSTRRSQAPSTSSCELRKDGEEEKERFLDQKYKLENADKSNFDYVVYDSDPERRSLRCSMAVRTSSSS